MFGSEPVYHALIYANDLKLSHYVKIPPRDMFWVQMWGALMGTLITVGQWQWLLDLPKVCTKEAPFRLICPAGEYNPVGRRLQMDFNLVPHCGSR